VQLERVLREDPKYPTALLAMGRLEINAGTPQAAIEPLNRADTLAIQLGNDPLRADVLQAVGIAFKLLERPSDALGKFRESLAIKRRLGNEGGAAGSLSEIAQVQWRLGNQGEALKSFQEAEQIRRRIDDRRGLGNTLLDFGTFHLEQGRYDAALAAYSESLRIQREVGNPANEGRALNNIGSVHFEKGQYDEAVTYFQQALAIREKLPDRNDVGQTRHNLAEAQVRMGQFDRALEQYLASLDIARTSGQNGVQAIEEYSIGSVFEYQGRYGAALKSRREAHQHFSTVKDRSFWRAEIMAGYGRSLMLVGEMDEARKVLGEALAVAREQGNEAVVARVLNDEAELLRLSGDSGTARQRLDEAAQIAVKTGDRFLQVRTQVNQALLLTRDAQRAGRAATTLGTLAQEADQQGAKALAIEAALGRIEALLTMRQDGAALSEAERAVTRADNLRARMLQARAHYLAGRAAQATGGHAITRRHFTEVVRLLETASREEGAARMTRRADLAEMLNEAKKILS
jgi:tetratricopeptide (TPR) repeat protein